MKPSELKKLSIIPVESYDKKNCRRSYDAKKRIVSEPSKASMPIYESTILRLES